MALESKGDCFYKNISIEQHTVYFQTPQTKFLHITMLLLELQDDV